MDSFEVQNENEYFVTALQIFDFCGVRSTGSLSVETLMDKFSASEKSNNRSEYKHLKHILDPEECNPDIDVTKLADALHKYSESQKVKIDLEDSFNLKSGGVPQDSDSGISNDGFQLLEELQCELREKSQLTSRLRDQMYVMEQQNDELLSGLTSERDALKAQILLLREEKQKYLVISDDYEDACHRLISIESAFEEARRDLDIARKNSKVLQGCIDQLQSDNHSLEEQLLKSKEECHRINEMYASRQAFLLEENETLKSAHAEISTKYDDQQHVIEKIIQEKALLEMELKDILNKSDESPRFDRTIDVSYPDDQMLSTLDSLTADSKFGQQQILEEDSFEVVLNNSQGRLTNMTLFDEIRLSYSSSLRAKEYINEAHTISTQTELNSNCESGNECAVCSEPHNLEADNPSAHTKRTHTFDTSNNACLQCDSLKSIIVKSESGIPKTEVKETQTFDTNNNICLECYKLKSIIDKLESDIPKTEVKETQTFDTNNNICLECYKLKSIIDKLESDIPNREVKETQTFDSKNNNNDINFCPNCDNFKIYINKLEKEIQLYAKYNSIDKELKNKMRCNKINTETQTDNLINNYCNKSEILSLHDEQLKLQITNANNKLVTRDTQTLPRNCSECELLEQNNKQLQLEIVHKNKILKEMDTNFSRYDENIGRLESATADSHIRNRKLLIVIDYLKCKLVDVHSAFEEQKLLLNNLNCDKSDDGTQTDCVLVNTSTQVDQPCETCTKRVKSVPRKLSSFFWNATKSLFQIFAVLCFCMALLYMYNVMQQHMGRECRRSRIPWNWFNLQDILDLALRIEYVGEIPM